MGHIWWPACVYHSGMTSAVHNFCSSFLKAQAGADGSAGGPLGGASAESFCRPPSQSWRSSGGEGRIPPSTTSQLPTRLPPLTPIAQIQALQTWSQEAGTDRMWALHAAERRLYEVQKAPCQHESIHAISFGTHTELNTQQTQTCTQEDLSDPSIGQADKISSGPAGSH